jgi:hypothetical protein
MRHLVLSLLPLSLLAIACVPKDDGDAGNTELGDGDGDATETTGDGDPDGTSAGDGDGDGDPCTTAAQALAPMLTSELGGCDIVVRFDYQTLAPLGLSSRCGDYKGAFIGEPAARMMSDCCSGGQLLSPQGDDGFYLFYSGPGDIGGVAAISNHLVTRMFEATIYWHGTGEISDPSEWLDAAQLGSGGEGSVPAAQSYDLISNPGAPIDPTALEALLAALADTSVLPAIASGNNTVYRMVVLAYPRTVGEFDPTAAEYVVLLEAGA